MLYMSMKYPKMYPISSGIALLKNKDVKIYRTLMFEHVRGKGMKTYIIPICRMKEQKSTKVSKASWSIVTWIT